MESELYKPIPERATPPERTPYHRQTPEERAQERQDQRARHLRDGGLERLNAGEPCTPTQAPFVGEYIKSYEARIAGLERQVQKVTAQLENEQERMDRIITEWNEVWTVLDALDIHLYERHGHEWDAQIGEEKAHGENCVSIGEALKAALLWRFDHSS